MTRPLAVIGALALAAASFALGSYFYGAERGAERTSASTDSEELARRLRSIDAELRSARRDREVTSASDLVKHDLATVAERAAAEAQPRAPEAPEPKLDELQPVEPSTEQLAIEAEAEALLADAIRAGSWRDIGEFRTRLRQLTRDQQVALAERLSVALNEGKLRLEPGEVPF